ncbi:hypothetical protein [Pelomonas cellulosilytica]|uniref:hypothetical protein n=1 Tax=Pelomonas cellulosilytica TaxID=2906762 RepID=UPI003B0255B5
MSLASVQSRALDGLVAAPVTVEVHLANGLSSFTAVRLADTEAKEACERLRAALADSGLRLPANGASQSTSHRPTCPRRVAFGAVQRELLLPKASAARRPSSTGWTVRQARQLPDVAAALQPEGEARPCAAALSLDMPHGLPDLADIKGQAGGAQPG